MIGVVVEVLRSCETRHFTGRSPRPANNFHLRFACYYHVIYGVSAPLHSSRDPYFVFTRLGHVDFKLP
jgi:hypothetical protein